MTPLNLGLSLSGNAIQQGYWSGTPAQKGVANEVWIAVRTDSQPGAGTAEDPFDGSTQPKFDALMTSFGPCTTIHLLPGTFLTNGWGDDALGTHGWVAKSGQKFFGSGMGVTVLRLASIPSTATNVKMISGPYNAEVNGVEVRNLTLDCDSQHLVVPSGCAVGGVLLMGSGNVLDGVEVLNPCGDSTGNEGFAIALNPLDAIYGGTPTTGMAARNCRVSGFRSGTHTGHVVGISVGSLPGIRGDGIVTGCVVTGNADWNAYGGGAIHLGNQAIDCAFGFRQDIGTFQDVVIAHNYYKTTTCGIQFSAQGAFGSFGRILIEGNCVDNSGTLPGILIQGDSAGTYPDLRIAGNMINETGTTGSLYAVSVDNTNWKNVWVEGNVSNQGPYATGADGSDKFGNNYWNGAYSPDSNVPLLDAANAFKAPLGISINSGSDLPVTATNAASASFIGAGAFRAPNLTAGQSTFVQIGVGAGTYNSASLSYVYAGAGSSANAFGVGFYGTSSFLTVLGTGQVGPANGGFLTLPSAPPASSSATGVAGTIAWDAGYLYVCTSANAWKRSALSSW